MVKYILFSVVTIASLFWLDLLAFQAKHTHLAASMLNKHIISNQPTSPLTVEVFIDARYHHYHLIKQSYYEVQQRLEQVGISIKLHRWQHLNIPKAESLSTVLKRHRSTKAQIAIVFSPRSLSSQVHNSDETKLAGYADPLSGTIFIKTPFQPTPAQKNSLTSTMLHEFAHLFYVEHDSQIGSYIMSPQENESHEWSPQSRATLSVMRYRPWW